LKNEIYHQCLNLIIFEVGSNMDKFNTGATVKYQLNKKQLHAKYNAVSINLKIFVYPLYVL